MILLEGAIDDRVECVAALSALSEVSLVKHDPFEDGTPAVTVHRLVQVVARARSKAMCMTRRATDRLIERLAAIFPKDGHDNPQSWALCTRLTPHVLVRREANSEQSYMPADWSELLNRAASYFHGRGSYVRAAALFRDAIAIREKAFGQEHVDTASSLNDLALLLRDRGDLAEARGLAERAVAIRNDVLGPGHADTADSLNNLALVRRAQGDLAGARLLHERTLAIREKVLGPEHANTGQSLNNLGVVLQVQGDLVGARSLFERALAIRVKVRGPEHPNTNRTRVHLARLLLINGQPTEAFPLAEVALAAHDKILGPNHPWTVDSARATADALDALGRVEEAAALRARYGLVDDGK